MSRSQRTVVFLFGLLAIAPVTVRAQPDPLPSWAEGETKRSILDFAARVTTVGGPEFVPEADRLAVFDNDGTLWCEQPVYVQAVFVRDRIRTLAAEHPAWKAQEPYSTVLSDDRDRLAAIGEKGFIDLITATHAGMSVDDFAMIVRDWLATARHPRFHRPYTRCVYQPMLELLAYLRSHGFTTFIVSGGGVEFMRVWAMPVYGIPTQQVVGSTIATQYQLQDDRPVLMRLPKVDFIDDGPGKPVGIFRQIGRRPIAAFGNSDGDYEMLRYVTSGSGARFGLIVHHTDAEREYAYDSPSAVGQLVRALDEAPARGWTVVDMKRDWTRIFPPEPPR